MFGDDHKENDNFLVKRKKKPFCETRECVRYDLGGLFRLSTISISLEATETDESSDSYGSAYGSS